jgi:LytS/YehU family sensor histidine kinase
VLGTFVVIALGLETSLSFARLLALSLKASVAFTLLIGVVQATIQRLKDRLHETERKLQAQAVEHERALKLASEARLAALEARVNPHFLFNALNTVSSLIPREPDKAERLIERLSALLRSSLDNHHGRLVSLAQEVNLVRDYLEIQNARFGERLRFAFDVDDSLGTLRVPPFSVQTLVENSVKFAVASGRTGADVQVRARRESGRVRIEVGDTGPGFSLDDIPAGHGLDNLRGRLTMTFGADTPGLEVQRGGGWTTVSFQVPQ